MASVHCPKDVKIQEMKECLSCEYIRKEDDASTIWCRYAIGKIREQETDLRKYYAQINYKTKLADKLYKTGKPYAADEIMRQVTILRKELKEHENKNSPFNTEKKTVI